MNLLITKDAIQAAVQKAKLPRETVECPEIDCKFILQGMSGTERDGWEKSLIRGRGQRRDVDTENVRARLAVRCIINEAGERVLSDGDAAWFGQLRVDVLNRIFEVAQRLSGVGDKDIDELKKFSETAAGSDSPTS